MSQAAAQGTNVKTAAESVAPATVPLRSNAKQGTNVKTAAESALRQQLFHYAATRSREQM
jgi:hypothetical protein